MKSLEKRTSQRKRPRLSSLGVVSSSLPLFLILPVITSLLLYGLLIPLEIGQTSGIFSQAQAAPQPFTQQQEKQPQPFTGSQFTPPQQEPRPFLSILKHLIPKSAQSTITKSNTSSTSNNNTLTYKNSTYGVTMQYPASWTLINSNLTHTQYRYDKAEAELAEFDAPGQNDSTFIAVWRDDLNSTESLDIYAAEEIQTDKSNYLNFSLISNHIDTTLLGEPAYSLLSSFTNVDPDGGTHFMLQREIGTVIGDEAYSIVYTGEITQFYNDLPVLQKMIDSMQVNVSKINSTQTAINPDIPEV